jgi:hypothetical protein
MITTDIALRCRCGAVRGRALNASAATGTRVICYCRDCQAFARFLGTPGILDAFGGSDAFQTTPSQVRIDSGADKLACMRLSEKGLLRWYTACCRSPIGNMLSSARCPFIVIVQPFMDPGEGRTLDQLLGPPRLRVQKQGATAALPNDLEPQHSLPGFVRLASVLLKSILFGRHKPSPFFKADGMPVVSSEILTPARHEALRATPS